MKLTIQEVVAHLSEHYGITKTQVVELLRISIHPRTLRDELAMAAMATIPAYAEDIRGWHVEDIAGHIYGVADAALKERLK